jgi:hypothetical protein
MRMSTPTLRGHREFAQKMGARHTAIAAERETLAKVAQ